MIPIKKNRNKKGLALIGSETLPRSTSGPIQVSGSTRSLKLQESGSTSDSSNSTSSPLFSNSDGGDSRSSYHSRLSEQLANLELGVEFKLDLKEEDLEILEELGCGNGGTVSKCVHVPTRSVMAKKVVHIATSPATRKQILRELQILHDCSSPFIVSFYGAYLSDPHICMCMEFMDKGSLDTIYKKVGPIPEPILAKIALAVVSGLTYLYDVHKIMHRDVKPSNVLLNSHGNFKICDFGVSGEMINSVADTFVGTSTYMSPERISGDPYTVKSDVWSLGITLVELAIGRFPFSSASSTNEEAEFDQDDETVQGEGSNRLEEETTGEETLSPVRPGRKSESLEAAEKKRSEKRNLNSTGVSLSGSSHQMSILELLQYIVNEPSPALPTSQKIMGKNGWEKAQFSDQVRDFISQCLRKEPIGWNVRKKGELPIEIRRPVPKELLQHVWLIEATSAPTDVEKFAKSIP